MADTEVVTGYFRGEGGGIHAMDLPLPEVMREKLTKGYLTRVNEDGTTYTEPADEAPSDVPLAPRRPTQSASKAEWVGYAVHHPDPARRMTPDDADALTRHDLVERFGKDTPPGTPAAGAPAAGGGAEQQGSAGG